jgi:amino acid adenylation domain-containing protein
MYKSSSPSSTKQIQYTSHPLSYGQQALWFLYQTEPQSTSYNIFISVKVNSKLDLAAFYKTWQRVVDRHPILRTTYAAEEGRPIQKIYAHREVDVRVIEAANWDEEYLIKRIYQETDLPFNLEVDSVLRVRLFTQTVEKHVLLLTMHHIASDMWSFDLLINEFRDLYAEEIEGKQADSDDSWDELAYTKFVDWQLDLLDGDQGKQQWNYWQEQLAGELTTLNLPSTQSSPARDCCREAAHFLALDRHLIQKLKNQALGSGTSLYKILLTTFYVLLHRYTSQEDIFLEVPMLGRSSKEFKKVVGYFVNSTAVRCHISGELTFEELLSQISNTLKEAQKSQDYPFPLLVKELKPQRHRNGSTLFQVSFASQKQHWYQSEGDLDQEQTLQIAPYPLGHQRGTTSDLDVSVMEVGESLQIGWQFNTDLFDAEAIARMSEHFQTLLQAIVNNPNQRIIELPLLTETEQHRLLVDWNDTNTEYPQEKCIHQLFEEQVERSPDAIAVVFENEKLTYRELNQRANQLAHYLQTLGVCPEVLVGICVERSLEMIIGIIGILKAGGAYVPLDPAYPQERLAFMIEDAAVPVLLTQAHLAPNLPSHSAQVVYLDKDWKDIDKQSQEQLTEVVKANNLAYVIYTSGSTGRPKGVLLEHQGLCNLVIAQQQLFDVKPESRILQFVSFSFDVSVGEIFTALTTGATLVLSPKEAMLPGQPLLKLLREQAITIVSLPPSTLAVLPFERLPALQTIVVGGETCAANLVARWSTGRRFFNAYGPTESTICATASLCGGKNQEIVIGRPIANTQIYILDQHLQLVPIGIAGELYIGGDGLARGYLKHPDLTQEKFILNPFSSKPRARFYKTGDLARYLPDGNIELLGRIDHQVKIRGFRIEIGEIEAALTQYSDIREAVVIAREDTPGDKRLVAYFTVRQMAFSPRELRDFLKQRLPDYMVPAAFVQLDLLPLTPNGKVDRRAMPAPKFHSELEQDFVAPKTPIEVALVKIWGDILKVNPIGVNDNFFELGGHSLLATQIISRIQEAAKITLPLQKLLESPTISSLSKTIELIQNDTQLKSDFSHSDTASYAKKARDGLIPLSFPQEYIWYIQHLDPHSSICNSGVAIRLTGSISIAALEKSINEIIRRHEVLRTTFSIIDGQPRQSIANSLALSLKVIDLRMIPTSGREYKAQCLANQEISQPFNLSSEPLIRATALQLSDQETWLLVPMHHLLTDGWSCDILLQELDVLYYAFVNHLPSSLPDISFQYADFTLWQRHHVTEEVLQKQLAYWQKQLAYHPGLSQEKRLSPIVSRRAEQYFPVLTSRVVTSIKTLCESQNTTVSVVLLTALKILLFQWSEEPEIILELTLGNRNIPEGDKMIGCFINDVILRSFVSDDQLVISFLKDVQQTVWESINHKDIPARRIAEIVRQSRSLNIAASLTIENVRPSQEQDRYLDYETLVFSPNNELWNQQIPLEVYASICSQEISLHVYYSPERFSEQTIVDLFQCYPVILQKMAETPNAAIAEFSLHNLQSQPLSV